MSNETEWSLVFLQQVVNGLIVGSQYALVALGLTVVYGIFGVINLAYGGVFMVGAFVAYFMTALFGLNFFVAMVIAMAAMALLMVAMERAVFNPLRNESMLVLLVASLGILVIINNAALVFWSPTTLNFFATGIPTERLSLLGLNVSPLRIVVFGVAVAVVVILAVFFRHTKMGKAIRAVAQNRESAAAVGISAGRMSMLVFGISGALAGAAGSLMGAMYAVTAAMGDAPLIKGLVIIILGGLGSMWGSIVGGLLLGVLECLAAYYITSPYVGALPLLLLIAIMLVRPQGLFGRKVGV